MTVRKALLAMGATVALASPLAALADFTWIVTDDEPGSRYVWVESGPTSRSSPPADTQPSRVGDISADREYVYLGEEGGWQSRQMENRFENGRLVHVDDPVGHMNRLADTRPLTEGERLALHHSFGS
jgi:hypothetical protein